MPANRKPGISISDDNQLLFQVPINKIENFERPAWEDRTEYAKTFAVSDLHGRFDLFAAILKTGEVIYDLMNGMMELNEAPSELRCYRK